MELYTIVEIGLIGILYARIVRVVWRKAGVYSVISKAQAVAFAAGPPALLAAQAGLGDARAPLRLTDALVSAGTLGLLAGLLGLLILLTPQPGVIEIASRPVSLPALDDRKLAGLLLLLAGGAYLAAICTTVRRSPHANADGDPAPEYLSA